MSQRIHSCTNNTNLDPIQCDTYTGRLLQREKTKSNFTQKPNQLRSSRDNAFAGGRSTVSATGRHISRPMSAVAKFTPQQGLYNDGFSEVMVRTHKPKAIQHTSPMRKNESWGKLLKPQLSRDNISSFTNFDPLRTIHFLAKELQHKLQQSIPNDTGVQHMIVELQQALSRIPPDLSITFEHFNKKPSSDRQDLVETGSVPFDYTPSKETINRSSQTPRHLYVEPDKLQQHLQESSEQIERACQQMENLCSKLKAEKSHLEMMLQKERDDLKDMSRQSEEFRNKYNATCLLVQTLEIKNQEFESEIRKLHVQLESQQGPTSQELKMFIEDLQKQKSSVEDECLQLKQKLTLARMENEKYQAVLDARDNQVKEIRNEMSQLQEVVNDQLMELQNNPFSSDTSSISNITASVSSACNNKLPSPNQRPNVNHLNRKPAHLKDHNYGDFKVNCDENLHAQTWNPRNNAENDSKFKFENTNNVIYKSLKTCHKELNMESKTKTHLKGKFTKVTNLALASCKSSTES